MQAAPAKMTATPFPAARRASMFSQLLFSSRAKNPRMKHPLSRVAA